MAVVLDVIQSGGTSATLHVAPGDTITFELAETIHSGELANALAGLGTLLQTIHGITLVANISGGAS